MSNSGAIAAFVGAIIVTFALCYFVLPIIPSFGGVKGPQGPQGIQGPQGQPSVVVQMKYAEFYNPAYIFDNNVTYTNMNSTVMDITTKGNTSLLVQFDAVFQVMINLPPGGFFLVVLTLGIDSVGNKTVYLQYYPPSGPLVLSEMVPFSLKYTTGILPSGTYHVTMQWESGNSMGGANFIAANYYAGTSNPFGIGGAYNVSRSLLTEEIAAP